MLLVINGAPGIGTQLVRDARARGAISLSVDGDVEETLDCLRAAVGTVAG